MEADELSPDIETPSGTDDVVVELVASDEPVAVIVDDDSSMESALLSPEASYARWQARRPPTSHLASGIIFPPGRSGPVPVFDIGSRLVVEQRSSFLDARPDPLDLEHGSMRAPWVRTVVGTVTDIDDDACVFYIQDESSDPRWPRVNAFSFDPKRGTDVFMAPPHGDPFDASAIIAAQRAAQRAAKDAADQALRAAGKKRGRGRPPGAKNRPKDVVKAEKETLRKIRAEKAARRAARKAGR